MSWSVGVVGGAAASTENWYSRTLKSELIFFLTVAQLWSLHALRFASKPLAVSPFYSQDMEAILETLSGLYAENPTALVVGGAVAAATIAVKLTKKSKKSKPAKKKTVSKPTPTPSKRPRRASAAAAAAVRPPVHTRVGIVAERVDERFERSAIASTAPRAVPPRPGDTLTIARARDVVGGARDRVGRSVRGPSTPPRREFERSAIASLRARSLTPNPPRRSSRP